jgi:endoglucanase Acf2
LPDGAASTFELFRAHAYAFVTDTKVRWTYDEATAEVSTTFQATVTAKETGKGLLDSALLALYRHQWLHTEDQLTGLSYVSPRGQMKLRVGNSFTTHSKYPGVLPVLPNAAGLTAGDLSRQMSEATDPATLFPKGFTGTSLPLQPPSPASIERGVGNTRR